MTNNPAFKPKSIEDQGGISSYLDKTVDTHNGLGSRVFKIAVSARVSDAALARMFNVGSVNTIKSWRKKLEGAK